MPYTLVIANKNYSSWSLRPWVLLRALGVPFVERVERFPGAGDEGAFQRFSPSGLVPVLIDGDRAVWDSLGITMYLADRHPEVWPSDEAARAFAESAAAEMHGGFQALRGGCSMSVGVRVRLRDPSPALARDVARLRALFEEGLTRFGGPWLAGARFTAVDAFYAPVAFRVRTYGLDVGGGQRWVDAALAHPAMKEWEAAALAETWREEGHEAAVRAAGEVTADHRAGA
ncbi:MAG: glutathione S-transferase [Polyangiaceae bacterium]|nr:glutathione S-transferase [Polyangiaceae bacterium]